LTDIYTNAPGQEQGLENAFGIQAQKGVQDPGQPQSQGQPQQQAPQQGQPETGAPEAPANVPGQPGAAQYQAPQQGQPEEVPEEKINNIRYKFQGNRQKLIEGITNVGQKIGKQIDVNKISVMSDDELYKEYALAEQEMGLIGSQQPQQSDASTQLNDANQKIVALTQYIANMQHGFHPPQPGMVAAQPNQMQGNTQTRDPKTGKFISPQGQGQQAAEDILNDLDIEDYDIDKAYEDPQYVKNYIINSIKKAVPKITETAEQQFERKLTERQQAETQYRKLTTDMQSRITRTQQKIGDQDFQKYRGLAGQIIATNPNLVQMREGTDPLTGQRTMDGFELAIRMAKSMSEGYNTQQQNQQQMQQQNQLNKQIAGMPQGTARTPGQQQNPNAAGLQQAFGIKF